MTQIQQMYEFRSQLHVSSRSEVHRATRRADGLQVVIKTVRGTTDQSHERARLICLREFQLLSLLADVDGVVKPIEFVPLLEGGALVLRDSGGVSLANSFDIVNNQVFLKNYNFFDLFYDLHTNIRRKLS